MRSFSRAALGTSALFLGLLSAGAGATASFRPARTLTPAAASLEFGQHGLISRFQLNPRRPVAIPLAAQIRAAQRMKRLGPMHWRRVASRPNGPAKWTAFVTDDTGYVFSIYSYARYSIGAVFNDCSGAEGAKVDHVGNLWVACTNTGTINMYAPGAAAATKVLVDNIAGVGYYTADVAVDDAGNVYASSLIDFNGNPGQVSYWTAANVCNGCPPSGQIADPNDFEGLFLDVTHGAAPSLFFDYLDVNGNGALDEIDNPMVAPVFTTQIAAGGIGFPGGVYVTQRANSVKVLDQTTRVITGYTIGPWAGSQFFAPTPQSLQGTCNPVAFGLRGGDKAIGVSDAGCHSLFSGKTKNVAPWVTWTNNFSSYQFYLPIGAAWFPSDK